MSNYNKLINNLTKLNLLKIKEKIDTYIDLVNDKKISIVDALYKLTDEELKLKEEKGLSRKMCKLLNNYQIKVISVSK